MDLEKGESLLDTVIQDQEKENKWCCRNLGSILVFLNVVFLLGILVGIVVGIMKINNNV